MLKVVPPRTFTDLEFRLLTMPGVVVGRRAGVPLRRPAAVDRANQVLPNGKLNCWRTATTPWSPTRPRSSATGSSTSSGSRSPAKDVPEATSGWHCVETVRPLHCRGALKGRSLRDFVAGRSSSIPAGYGRAKPSRTRGGHLVSWRMYRPRMGRCGGSRAGVGRHRHVTTACGRPIVRRRTLSSASSVTSPHRPRRSIRLPQLTTTSVSALTPKVESVGPKDAPL